MKKGLAIIMIIACVLGLSACGTPEKTENDYMTKADAITQAEGLCDSLNQMYQQSASDLDGFYKKAKQEDSDDANMVMAAVKSYADAADELGNYQGVVQGKTTAVVKDKEIVVNVIIQGDATYKNGKVRTAKEEIIFNGTKLSSMTTTVNYDMSEMMATAGLNTLLGMGTVFAILIIIVICLSITSNIIKSMTGKQKSERELVSETAAENTVNHIIAQEEVVQNDDTELVAVITAAIAASEGTSGDGLVVRSIIRRG